MVTLGIDYGDGKQPGRVIYELCRGDPHECLALMYRISTPSNDRRTIDNWWMQLGAVDDGKILCSHLEASSQTWPRANAWFFWR